MHMHLATSIYTFLYQLYCLWSAIFCWFILTLIRYPSFKWQI
jgi:hypothetical protein